VPIHYEKLLSWKIPVVEQRLTRRDTILYALGVGLGADPCDAEQLKFVYEERLHALPTMAIILGYPGPWHANPELGITRSHVVHGEQASASTGRCRWKAWSPGTRALPAWWTKARTRARSS